MVESTLTFFPPPSSSSFSSDPSRKKQVLEKTVANCLQKRPFLFQWHNNNKESLPQPSRKHKVIHFHCRFSRLFMLLLSICHMLSKAATVLSLTGVGEGVLYNSGPHLLHTHKLTFVESAVVDGGRKRRRRRRKEERGSKQSKFVLHCRVPVTDSN